MHLPHALAFFVSSLWRPAALRCWSPRNGVGPKSEALAAEDIGPESEALAVDGVGPELEALAAEDVVDPLLSVDDSDPLLSVAQDSQEPDKVIVVPDSQEVAADGVALDSQEPDEGITPELLELPPDSMDVVPDSMEVVPDSLPPGRLYAVAVVSFMRIAKHGTVHTRGSIHAAPTRWQKCARNQRK